MLGDVSETASPVKAVLLVDSKAGDLLGNIVKVDAQPIEIKFAGANVHSSSATLTAGTLARIETRSMGGADRIRGNEETWYLPLTNVSPDMPVRPSSRRRK